MWEIKVRFSAKLFGCYLSDDQGVGAAVGSLQGEPGSWAGDVKLSAETECKGSCVDLRLGGCLDRYSDGEAVRAANVSETESYEGKGSLREAPLTVA